MSGIVITTLNAKFIHAALGLRYIHANMGALREITRMVEFEISQKPMEVVDELLALQPAIIGLGVYVWNATLVGEIVALLKQTAPESIIILGGPEVSFDPETHPTARLADYVICGEGDLAFAALCGQILAGQPPADKVIHAPPPQLANVLLPYQEYSHEDLQNRLLYVETSRGCPFACEFCLSSVGGPLRLFPLERVLAAFADLLERGARHFKFVDRTFNATPKTCAAVMEFFLKSMQPDLFLHFEIAPDRLPDELRVLIQQFPPGSLQFEAGVQTFNPEVATRIQRRQSYEQLETNLNFLRRETNVHIHADLIAGLPGEDLESFAHGFDRLVALAPQEIQVGVLKRLRGAPIARHDAEWGMVYNPNPPYEILKNRLLNYETLKRIRRFARGWDLVANSGNFLDTYPLLWRGQASPFVAFMSFSEWLHQRLGRGYGIALARLGDLLFEYLTMRCQVMPEALAPVMLQDYQRGGRSDVPVFLRPWLPQTTTPTSRHVVEQGNRKRQIRRLGT